MNVTPKEEERLTVFMAAELARRRKDRGVRLNHPESVAYISDWCVERARDGWDVAEIRAEASQLLDPVPIRPVRAAGRSVRVRRVGRHLRRTTRRH